jgi:NAD(P)H-hydrate epimerase
MTKTHAHRLSFANDTQNESAYPCKKVLIAGGSGIYHGAPILSSLSARTAGSNIVVTIAIPHINETVTRILSTGSIVVPLPDEKLTSKSVGHLLRFLMQDRQDSAAIGMGMHLSTADPLKRLVKELLQCNTRPVLDASALVPEILGTVSQTKTVLTPHPGEYKRLFNEPAGTTESEIKSSVLKKAKDHGIIIVLKGSVNIISDGDQLVAIPRSTPAMTVGGTGDVLSGLIAGLLTRTQINSEFDACRIAVYLNGIAAMKAFKKIGLHMLATDLIEELPEVMEEYEGKMHHSLQSKPSQSKLLDQH